MSATTIELHADKAADGGACVGRSDARVVFCRLCLPGETVRAQLDAAAGPSSRFWRAEALEVVGIPSPHRRASPCPWFGPGSCGGCDWLHTDPQHQRVLKAQVLAETLARLGGIAWDGEVGSLGLESGWRTRATLHADSDARLGLRAARSHAVVQIDACLQMHAGLDLPGLLSQPWPAGAEVHVSLSESGRAVVVDGEWMSGPPEHVHTVAGRRFTRAVDGFWQSHVLAAGLLVERVRELAQIAASDVVADLYSGVGLLGLSLLDLIPAGSLTLVEGDRAAARHARINAGQDDRVRVIRSDVRRWRPAPADLVVLDPPRAGAGAAVVGSVGRSRPSTVVYVSCEPSTLARDLRLLADHGYVPDHIEAWDLFPGTSHVETIVRLRGGRGP